MKSIQTSRLFIWMLLVYMVPLFQYVAAQNVGIGNATPHAPLQFANNTGNRKIVLYEYVNNDHEFYGFGLNSGILRYQTATATDDHVFYSGTNGTSSRELMRVKGNGLVGIGAADPVYQLDLGSRMRIRGGGNDINSAGIWLNNNTNTALQAFIGITQTNVGFFGGNAGWGLMMSTETGNVGIGNTIPYSPLSFKQAIGKKISLYPGISGDAGFGVWGNELRIHSDNPNAAITFGYDSYNDPKFTEHMRITGAGNVGIGNTDPSFKLDIAGRMRIRSGGNAATSAGIWLNNLTNSGIPAFVGMLSDNQVGFYGNGVGWGLTMNTQNGALHVNGNPGQAGQLLTSNGAANAPAWSSGANLIQTAELLFPFFSPPLSSSPFTFNAITFDLTLTQPSRVILFYEGYTTNSCVLGSCFSKWLLEAQINGSRVSSFTIDGISHAAGTGSRESSFSHGPSIHSLAAGTYTFTFTGTNLFNAPQIYLLNITRMIIPL